LPEAFDKNRTGFQSDFHRDVWWWAIGMVPTEVSLTAEVKERISPDELAGCLDWHKYFADLCLDMHSNAGAYHPASPRQYRDILESVSAGGVISGDRVVWERGAWDAYADRTDRSKAYRTGGMNLVKNLAPLARLGIEVNIKNENVSVANNRYRKVFHAMRAMENSPKARDTTVRWFFAYCEFRQLIKSFNPGYEDLMRRASDESMRVADKLHAFARENGMARNIHFGIIKYKYNNVRIFDYNLYCGDTPTLRLKIGDRVMNPTTADLPAIYGLLEKKIRMVDKNELMTEEGDA